MYLNNFSSEGDRRRNTIRTLIHRKIPKWELLEQLRRVKITVEGGQSTTPYTHVTAEVLKKDLKIIATEDKAAMFDVMKDEWASSVIETDNDLKQAARIALNLAIDATTPPHVKLEAVKLFADLSVTRNQQMQEGPHVLVRGRENVLKEGQAAKDTLAGKQPANEIPR